MPPEREFIQDYSDVRPNQKLKKIFDSIDSAEYFGQISPHRFR